MPLIKNGALVADFWISVADTDPVPPSEPVIVSLERWNRERDALSQRNGRIGLRLKSSDSPVGVGIDLARFDVIAIEFPSFRDGRGFSTARRLRTQLGFTGELRAVGHIIPDQAQFLIRCGFDAVEVKPQARLADWQRGLEEFSVWYQPALDGRETAIARRHRRTSVETRAAE